ncbi:MAG: DinB family protein [Mucilaginibacter sp.]|uniref:DinB family protein n=1 Tax=Mucilaginibacter sp. TaxID=1882438 RepID=UPI0031ADB32C
METPKSTLIQPLPVLIGATAQDMLNTFALTPVDDLNRVPFKGSWTAGQLAEHVILSLSLGTKVIEGNTQATDRAPDKHVKDVKDLFLNFDLKFKSAPDITPADKPYDKDTLSTSLKKLFNGLINLAQTKDLTDTCLAAEFKGIGYLTGLEWAYQQVYHTQRHIQQLKDIQEHLGVN